MKLVRYILISLFILGSIAISLVSYTFSVTSGTRIISKNINFTDSLYYSPSGHILINVFINEDTTAYPFILDNGASTSIFKNLLDHSEFTKIAYFPTRDINKKLSLSPVYNVGRIELENGIIADNVTSKMFNPHFIICNKEVYGIIGRDIIKHFVWQFDFENRQYSVTSDINTLNVSNNAINIPIQKQRSKYFVSPTINGRYKKKLMIDLGSTSSIKYEMPQDSINYYFKNKNTSILGQYGYGLNGTDIETTNLMLIDSISFESYKIHDIEVTSSNKTLNILGLGFFKNFKTTFNFPESQLLLKENKQVNFLPKHFGIGFSFTDSLCSVDLLVKASIPHKKGIRIGDKVVKINQVVFDETFDKCKNVYSGDTLFLTIEKKGELINYSIPRHLYFKK